MDLRVHRLIQRRPDQNNISSEWCSLLKDASNSIQIFPEESLGSILFSLSLFLIYIWLKLQWHTAGPPYTMKTVNQGWHIRFQEREGNYFLIAGVPLGLATRAPGQEPAPALGRPLLPDHSKATCSVKKKNLPMDNWQEDKGRSLCSSSHKVFSGGAGWAVRAWENGGWVLNP